MCFMSYIYMCYIVIRGSDQLCKDPFNEHKHFQLNTSTDKPVTVLQNCMVFISLSGAVSLTVITYEFANY